MATLDQYGRAKFISAESGKADLASNVTRTVGTGKDHTTIQDAVDWFKSKVISGSCKIDVDAGTYVEHVLIEDIVVSGPNSLEIEGDTRVLAGMTFMDGGLLNPRGLSNGGSGAGTLANAGAVITVTGATTNPDFDADSWGNGDKLLVFDNASAVTEYTIDSVLNNTITLTVAAPAIGNDGTAIMLIPNTKIAPSDAGRCIEVNNVRGLLIDGLYLDTHTGANCDGLYADLRSLVKCENTASRFEDSGFQATGASTIYANDGACSVWDGSNGFYANTFGGMFAQYAAAVACTNGFNCYAFGHGHNQGSNASGCTRGFRANFHSAMFCHNCYARSNTTGFNAIVNSTVYASSTSANANNTTDYTPAAVPPGYAEDATNFGVLYAS
jgi:hypothetical protein